MHLGYSEALAYAVIEEILGMEQSATYRGLVRRSRAEEARRMLLLQGETKFGLPDAATCAMLESLDDPTHLEELGVHLITAASWEELLPPQRRRNGRRRARE